MPAKIETYKQLKYKIRSCNQKHEFHGGGEYQMPRKYIGGSQKISRKEAGKIRKSNKVIKGGKET